MIRRHLDLRTAALVAAWAWLLAGAGGTATAQAASPTAPQVVDPAGDANYLNDGGKGNQYGTPYVGDVITPFDFDDATDLKEIWFTHDRTSVMVHMRTEKPPGFEERTRLYHVSATPDAEVPRAPDCLLWSVVIGSDGAALNSNYARVTDSCKTGDNLGPYIGLEVNVLSDGSGVVTLITPRSYSPLFRNGVRIVGPWASTRLDSGATRAIDTTKRGDDYVLR